MTGDATPPVLSAVLHSEVSTFLALEAEALDSRRFDDWEELVDSSFTYRVPVPVVLDDPFAAS